MHFGSVQQCVTTRHDTHSLPLLSHPNSLLPGVNEAKLGVDERGGKKKPQEKETEGNEKGREMNNKCTMLESIFKARLEESGCKLRCSHDLSED